MFDIDFNADDFFAENPETQTNPIPAGVYAVVIDGVVKKETKAGTGSYLEITFQIIAGEHKNRLIWERLNLWNASPTAVKISQQSLAKLLRALGMSSIGKSEELEGQILEVRTILDRYTDRDGVEQFTPRIKEYRSRSNKPGGSGTTADLPW